MFKLPIVLINLIFREYLDRRSIRACVLYVPTLSKYLRGPTKSYVNHVDVNIERIILFNDLAHVQWTYRHMIKEGDNCNLDHLFGLTCTRGQFEIARWIQKIQSGKFCYGLNDIFYKTCIAGHFEIAQWLIEVRGEDIQNIDYGFDGIFWLMCCRGKLLAAQWLHGRGIIDVHCRDDIMIRAAFLHGHFDIVRWLYEIGLSIHTISQDHIIHARNLGHNDLVDWVELIKK